MISTKKMWALSGTATLLALAASTVNTTGCTVTATAPADGGSSSGASSSGASSSGASSSGASSSGASGSGSGSGSSSGTSSGGEDSGTSSGGEDGGSSSGTPSDSGASDGGFCYTGTSPVPNTTLVALACSQSTPAGVTVHNGVVYWTNNVAGGTVMSVPETGGTPTTIATNQDYPWAIAVDDNNVYWTNYDNGYGPSVGGSTTSGAVMKVALTGGTPVALDTGLEDPWGIAATNVYYTNAGGGRVKSVPIAGGTPTVLASGQSGPAGIAVDGTNVYWANYTGGTISSIAKTGTGTVKVLTSSDNAQYAVGVAVNSTTLFFTAAPGGTTSLVASMPLAGSATPIVLASGQDTSWGIVIDANNVYWTNNDVSPGGAVSSVPLAGGSITKLATNLNNPTSIAMDSTGLYFTTASGGSRVFRLTPP